MIGVIMLGNAGTFGVTGQIISSLKHRDKATNNALVAKAVEVCEKLGLTHLVYLFWSDDSLSEFKRRCGFERTRVPRYFVPLTMKGRMGLRAGLHRGWMSMVPPRVKAPLKRLRGAWYDRLSSGKPRGNISQPESTSCQVLQESSVRGPRRPAGVVSRP
jgi:hypothetical protein